MIFEDFLKTFSPYWNIIWQYFWTLCWYF